MKFWRKPLAALLVLALLAGGFAVSAAAGRHHSKAKHTLCPVNNCNTVSVHSHNGKSYAGHTMGDGHSYHRLCTVRSCTKSQSHMHSKVICLPHTQGDGHSYHRANHH